MCPFVFPNPNTLSSSALEELRAAHNLISEVPSSLGKNVALRTLDLGHNTIEGWGGLERVGKTLASLVQITLAGNPICTNTPSGMLLFRQPSYVHHRSLSCHFCLPRFYGRKRPVASLRYPSDVLYIRTDVSCSLQ